MFKKVDSLCLPITANAYHDDNKALGTQVGWLLRRLLRTSYNVHKKKCNPLKVALTFKYAEQLQRKAP